MKSKVTTRDGVGGGEKLSGNKKTHSANPSGAVGFGQSTGATRSACFQWNRVAVALRAAGLDGKEGLGGGSWNDSVRFVLRLRRLQPSSRDNSVRGMRKKTAKRLRLSGCNDLKNSAGRRRSSLGMGENFFRPSLKR